MSGNGMGGQSGSMVGGSMFGAPQSGGYAGTPFGGYNPFQSLHQQPSAYMAGMNSGMGGISPMHPMPGNMGGLNGGPSGTVGSMNPGLGGMNAPMGAFGLHHMFQGPNQTMMRRPSGPGQARTGGGLL